MSGDVDTGEMQQESMEQAFEVTDGMVAENFGNVVTAVSEPVIGAQQGAMNAVDSVTDTAAKNVQTVTGAATGAIMSGGNVFAAMDGASCASGGDATFASI